MDFLVQTPRGPLLGIIIIIIVFFWADDDDTFFFSPRSVSPTNTQHALTPSPAASRLWLEGGGPPFHCRRLTFSTVPNRSVTRRIQRWPRRADVAYCVCTNKDPTTALSAGTKRETSAVHGSEDKTYPCRNGFVVDFRMARRIHANRSKIARVGRKVRSCVNISGKSMFIAREWCRIRFP